MKPPKSSEALIERALRLQQGGQIKEAESLYRRVISLNRQHHRALWLLGRLLFDLGRSEEAGRCFERAVAAEPRPEYLMSLGLLLQGQGRLDVAAETFGRILVIDADYPDARFNLALTLATAGVLPEAVALLEEDVRAGADSPKVRVLLASLLLRAHRPQEAELHARRACELLPDFAAAHRQLADSLDASGRKSEAIVSYRRALELDPDNAAAHSNLIVAMLSIPEYDAQAIFAEVRAWAARYEAPLAASTRAHSVSCEPERRLRIGYVSPDFRGHPIQQFMVPLLRQHDPSAFEVFLYSSVARPDAETGWYRDFAGERFRDIFRLSDAQAAELVRADAIDILVDLALHSEGNRLRVFAHRPAPVQVSWLGYAGTTGLDAIDYRITDPFVDPPGSERGVYSEECLVLPETMWCYSALNSELTVSPLPAQQQGVVTFGSQNTYRKLHAGVIALWARVLRRVPESRLFLYAEEHGRAGLCQAFLREGVEPERLEFGGRVSRAAYLERYQRIDIGLDTFPFNGATTTLDAVWMGVPVVTLTGPSALQRAGACIAGNLGLPELVATSEAEFVEVAARLASELESLSELRAGLRARLERSPLGDAARFARHLEAAYRGVWRRYCESPR